MGASGARGGGSMSGDGLVVGGEPHDVRDAAARGAAPPADVRVSDVTSTGTSPGLLALAGVAGALAALLVVLVVASRWPAFASARLALPLGLLAWGLATWWVARGAFRLRVLLRRGFGLGAWLWLALALAHEPAARAGGGRAAAVPEGLLGAAEWLADPVARVMLWVCALGYGLLWLASRPAREVGLGAGQRARERGPLRAGSIQK